jgi:hypothetical protein
MTEVGDRHARTAFLAINSVFRREMERGLGPIREFESDAPGSYRGVISPER